MPTLPRGRVLEEMNRHRTGIARKRRGMRRPPKARSAHELLYDLGDRDCPQGSDPPTAELVRDCRTALGMTQQRFGDMLGISAAAVSKAECGESSLSRPSRMLLVLRIEQKAEYEEWKEEHRRTSQG